MKKIIDGYENYTISDEGYVTNELTGKILKGKFAGRGYRVVNLFKDGKFKNHYIHRLVAIAFLPNPDNLPEVNHKDEDKTNNKVENLEWCSHKYNMNYGTGQQRRVMNTDFKAIHEKIKNLHLDYKAIAAKKNMKEISKKYSKQVINLDTLIVYSGTREAERQTNIEHSSISKCCMKKENHKTAGGYRWMYYNDYKNIINNGNN